MYNFIFWFFYRFNESKNGFKSVSSAAWVVGIAIIIHLSLIHSITRYFTGFTIGTFSEKYAYNKLVLLPFVILFCASLYWFYYKKRGDEILSKYENKSFSTPRNILLILAFMVIPVITLIILTNSAIGRW